MVSGPWSLWLRLHSLQCFAINHQLSTINNFSASARTILPVFDLCAPWFLSRLNPVLYLGCPAKSTPAKSPAQPPQPQVAPLFALIRIHSRLRKILKNSHKNPTQAFSELFL
jgi:hypothetical protein